MSRVCELRFRTELRRSPGGATVKVGMRGYVPPPPELVFGGVKPPAPAGRRRKKKKNTEAEDEALIASSGEDQGLGAGGGPSRPTDPTPDEEGASNRKAEAPHTRSMGRTITSTNPGARM